MKTLDDRLLSLDFFRGFTMFLLIAEGTPLFRHMVDPSLNGTLVHAIGTQFHHHPWNGLRLWDLVQPFFMFIVGVAIPFSVAKRMKGGDDFSQVLRHAALRSLLLLFLGVTLASIGPGEITFQFQNVLAQLSVTYLVAVLLMRFPVSTQLIVSFALILLSYSLYRFCTITGYDHPFVADRNFGAYVDMLISGKLSGGHWVSFNAIPTTAHTIWGVLAGQLLMSDRPGGQKIKFLVLAGLIGVVVGYALDPYVPIIKRICTSSFVIVSGGWCLLALAFSHWLIDLKGTGNWPKVFVVVGMNPLFIYLFAQVGGGKLIQRLPKPFVHQLFSWAGETCVAIVNGFATWFLLWFLCYWLYRRRIFLKI